MHAQDDDSVRFKFKWVDGDGKVLGLRSKPGRVDGQHLTLDGKPLPLEAILEVRANEKLLSVWVPDEEGGVFGTVLRMVDPDAATMLGVLNRSRSRRLDELHREVLRRENRLHEHHSTTCPRCEATVVLTGLPATPQVYCDYCAALWSPQSSAEEQQRELVMQLCDECGMYSAPRKFSIVYFYFLLIFWGVHHNVTTRCPGCMRPVAWRMLWLNLPFLLGVPVALTQLYRSYLGPRAAGLWPRLDDANIQARRGNVDRALEAYGAIIDVAPINAGVKYNVALGLVAKGDLEHARTMLQMALEDCGNYYPAEQMLADLDGGPDPWEASIHRRAGISPAGQAPAQAPAEALAESGEASA